MMTPKKMGWSTGFEPATARSTIWGSNQAELRPPQRVDKLLVLANPVKFELPADEVSSRLALCGKWLYDKCFSPKVHGW